MRRVLAAVVALSIASLFSLPAAAGAGTITKLEGSAGCVADAGASVPAGECTRAKRIADVTDVAISPDGRFLYAAATSSNAIAVFSRDPESGELTQLPGARGCIVANGVAPGCASADGLEHPSALAISPGGENVYVTTSGMAFEPAILYAIEVLGHDRVLYAMDYPYQFVPEEVLVTDRLPLSADHRAMLYQRNAERVFKLG